MPQVEFEPTIPASDRAKTVHALNIAATVTGYMDILDPNYHPYVHITRIWGIKP
jgi:hypothetical protein